MSTDIRRLLSFEGRDRFLSRQESSDVVRRIRGFPEDDGSIQVSIESWWSGELRWARSRVSLASDRRDIKVTVKYTTALGPFGVAATNQVDDESLRDVTQAAKRDACVNGTASRPADLDTPWPALEFPKTSIWSDATYNQSTESRGAIARDVVDSADAQQMISAGYLEVRGQGLTLSLPKRDLLYAECTQAQCSMTVRDARGTGSGWAGLTSYDWGAIDAPALAKRALAKCMASRNPVSLEPGRYTVILEPQAVHDLISPLMDFFLDRVSAEMGSGPFALGEDPGLGIHRTKLGLKVIDERLTIGQDPLDPALGVIPFAMPDLGEPIRPVNWIERGVLTNLATFRSYALEYLNENQGYPNSFAFRMSGGDTSIDEMISSTKRGLLVTRFSSVRLLDQSSLLCTGLTRDGLWLIENGKISKPVKNFRFTESPLFALNSIEQLGLPTPVFRVRNNGRSGVTPAIVPALKARDFSFTSLIDAV